MKVILLLGLSFAFFSCSERKNSKVEKVLTEKNDYTEEAVVAESSTEEIKECGFIHDESGKDLKITGYKFEDKTGVTGTFKKWKLKTAEMSKSLDEFLMSSNIVILEESLEFGKPARNTNIFKGLLENIPGKQIRAIVMAVEAEKNSAIIELIWGGKSHTVDMNYSYVENVLTLKGSIDLLELGFSKAFEALSKLCKPHHMKNGTAKTWSTVDIEISSKVLNTCS